MKHNSLRDTIMIQFEHQRYHNLVRLSKKIKRHLSNDCRRFCLWYCYQHDKNVSSSLCNLRLATRVIHILSFTSYLFDIDTVYVFKCLVILISCLYFWRYCDSRIFIRNFTLGTGRTVWFHQGPVGSCCTFRKKIMIDKFSEYYDLRAEVSLKLQFSKFIYFKHCIVKIRYKIFHWWNNISILQSTHYIIVSDK